VGAAIAALAAGEFRPRLARPRALLLALLGGVLLGFGAFVASGCTVGALLSGVMAFSLHGWVFGAGLVGGAFAAVALLRRIAPRPAPLLDLRGESCGMPELRLAALLDAHDRSAPIAVLVEDARALESLLPIARGRGFTGRIESEEDGSCRAVFRADDRAS
jgi:TusA-related sulfurtransferase